MKDEQRSILKIKMQVDASHEQNNKNRCFIKKNKTKIYTRILKKDDKEVERRKKSSDVYVEK